MLFLPGCAETWAHDSAFVLAAFSNAYTAQSCLSKTAIVLGKLEMSLRLPRIVGKPEAQIVVHAVGKHDFARIHSPIGVPQGFEAAKGFHQFRAKHFRQEFSAGLTVAMLAGKRAAVRKHQVCGLLHEAAKFLYAVVRVQIEAQAV